MTLDLPTIGVVITSFTGFLTVYYLRNQIQLQKIQTEEVRKQNLITQESLTESKKQNQISSELLDLEKNKNQKFVNFKFIITPDYWHRDSTIKIKLMNTGNVKIQIWGLYLSRKSSIDIGKIESVIHLTQNEKIFLPPHETYEKEFSSRDLPPHTDLFFELRYYSEIDNYSRMIFLTDKQTFLVR